MTASIYLTESAPPENDVPERSGIWTANVASMDVDSGFSEHISATNEDGAEQHMLADRGDVSDDQTMATATARNTPETTPHLMNSQLPARYSTDIAMHETMAPTLPDDPPAHIAGCTTHAPINIQNQVITVHGRKAEDLSLHPEDNLPTVSGQEETSVVNAGQRRKDVRERYLPDLPDSAISEDQKVQVWERDQNGLWLRLRRVSSVGSFGGESTKRSRSLRVRAKVWALALGQLPQSILASKPGGRTSLAATPGSSSSARKSSDIPRASKKDRH